MLTYTMTNFNADKKTTVIKKSSALPTVNKIIRTILKIVGIGPELWRTIDLKNYEEKFLSTDS